MKKLYFLPSVVTSLNLIFGLFVIFKMNMIEPGSGYFHVMRMSAIILLLAALADVFDGTIARIFHAESKFGVIFDSLADTVSFGVAPSVVLLKTLSLQPGTWLSFVAGASATIFSLCNVLRLARFNVMAEKSRGNIIEMTAQKKNFTGLPVPAAALAIVSINLFFLSPTFERFFVLSEMTRALILSGLMVILGYFMVSRWKFPSLKALNLRVSSFYLVFLTVLVTVLFLYGLIYNFPIVFVFICWSYIVIGWTFSVIRIIAGKKSKTLEDFEPDNDIFDEEDRS